MTASRLALTALAILTTATVSGAQDTTNEVDRVRQADEELVESITDRDIERWLGFFADDGAMWPPCGPRIIGKDAIRATYEGYFADPTFAVAHHIEDIVVARSGELAYVTYTYEMGNPVFERGKDVTLYRKETDGAWKIVIDMWSTDAPPCD